MLAWQQRMSRRVKSKMQPLKKLRRKTPGGALWEILWTTRSPKDMLANQLWERRMSRAWRWTNSPSAAEQGSGAASPDREVQQANESVALQLLALSIRLQAVTYSSPLDQLDDLIKTKKAPKTKAKAKAKAASNDDGPAPKAKTKAKKAPKAKAKAKTKAKAASNDDKPAPKAKAQVKKEDGDEEEEETPKDLVKKAPEPRLALERWLASPHGPGVERGSAGPCCSAAEGQVIASTTLCTARRLHKKRIYIYIIYYIYIHILYNMHHYAS